MKFEDLLLVLLVLCFGYLLEFFGNLFTRHPTPFVLLILLLNCLVVFQWLLCFILCVDLVVHSFHIITNLNAICYDLFSVLWQSNL